MSSPDFQLPPGFRFHLTNEELMKHYQCRKCASQPISVPIIAEIELYKYDTWELPGLVLYGEKRWYLFSPGDRKYLNGYWKATSADKQIGHQKSVGIKKALVFYAGKAPYGQKTNWIMQKSCLADVDRSPQKKNSLRLDDWVMCQIYNKKGTVEKHSLADHPTLDPSSAHMEYFSAPEDPFRRSFVVHLSHPVAFSLIFPPRCSFTHPQIFTPTTCHFSLFLPTLFAPSAPSPPFGTASSS